MTESIDPKVNPLVDLLSQAVAPASLPVLAEPDPEVEAIEEVEWSLAVVQSLMKTPVPPPSFIISPRSYALCKEALGRDLETTADFAEALRIMSERDQPNGQS